MSETDLVVLTGELRLPGADGGVSGAPSHWRSLTRQLLGSTPVLLSVKVGLYGSVDLFAAMVVL